MVLGGMQHSISAACSKKAARILHEKVCNFNDIETCDAISMGYLKM